MVENQSLATYNLSSGLPRQDAVVLIGEVLADVFPDRTVLGGAPFNVARHLQAFGLLPLLITRVGNDKLGRELLATMTHVGMTIRGVQQDPIHQTGQVLVQIEEGKHRFEIPSDQAYDFIQTDEAQQVVLTAEPELIYFGTLAQRNSVSCSTLNNILRTAKTASHVLDINLREPWYTAQTIQHSLRHADIVKMNEDELDVIAKLLNIAGDNAYVQAASLIKQFSLKQLLVTCGAQGVWQLDADGEKHFQQGTSAKMMDTVGAGDGFTAVFITGTLRGWSDTLILSRANSFAAALCGIRGAIPNELEFYNSFLEDWAE